MKLTKMMMALALPGLVYAAAPAVSSINVSQDEQRLVTISYTLSGAGAIVTMDVLTNGVSIGRTLYANATGDVNVKVSVGNHAITWQPRETWPDQKIRDNSLSVKLTVWPLDNPPDYMCVDLTKPSTVEWYITSNDVPGGVTADIYKTDKLLMRRIHAEGIRWRMGLPKDGGTNNNWEPGHFVTLTNDYYMAIFEMTIGQRSRIVDGTAAASADYPDLATSYQDLRGTDGWPAAGYTVAQGSVLDTLRRHAGINGFDLPTQAEWEYAARAGSYGYYHWGFETSTNAFKQYEWIQANTRDVTVNRECGGDGSYHAQKVGLLKPNAWGLYDMHGNCFERVLDWYAAADGYSKHGSDVIAPPGPATGSSRVIHGAGYTHNYNQAYVFYREGYAASGKNASNVGYRLACVANFNDAQ